MRQRMVKLIRRLGYAKLTRFYHDGGGLVLEARNGQERTFISALTLLLWLAGEHGYHVAGGDCYAIMREMGV